MTPGADALLVPYSSARPKGASPPFFVSLHTGEGILDRQGMANYLDDNPGASAHAASDAGGVVAPLVPYSRAAWTAGPTANSYGLHIEMCAFACMPRELWLSEKDVNVWVPWLNNGRGANRLIRSPLSMLRHTAAWVRDRCAEFEISVRKISAADLRADRDGICGHADTSAAWGETDHTDPGPGFPWPEFIALVQGQEEDDMPYSPEQLVDLVKKGIYEAKGNDGRNVLDSVIQTRNELRDRAREAVAAELAGLTAAVGRLTEAVATGDGVTADELKQAVTDAIRENVVKVDIDVQGEAK